MSKHLIFNKIKTEVYTYRKQIGGCKGDGKRNETGRTGWTKENWKLDLEIRSM